MSEKLWRAHDSHAPDIVSSFPDEIDAFEHVVHVTLRVNPARNRETHQLESSRAFYPCVRIRAEHHSANFDAADTRFEIQFDDQ